MTGKLKKLLLALGSEIIMDEAISIMLAKDLKQLFPEFELRIMPLGGTELIELIAGFDLVVIIDTMMADGGKQGEMVLITDFESAFTLHLHNPHDISFQDTLKLAGKLGYRIPDKIILIGIRIKQSYVASGVPSQEILEEYNRLLDYAGEVIRQQSDF
jgi:hydrogenase maturation protease